LIFRFRLANGAQAHILLLPCLTAQPGAEAILLSAPRLRPALRRAVSYLPSSPAGTIPAKFPPAARRSHGLGDAPSTSPAPPRPLLLCTCNARVGFHGGARSPGCTIACHRAGHQRYVVKRKRVHRPDASFCFDSCYSY
jgi:hypothetical protein